ncbi:hypothetical protein [Crossiella cryophila]|uniref:Uncharacterized protein n=1 Tax=Crossiella cryophila TaxID=43355 RepID=A0A7W7CEH4_9PSEU|nr:hypothetical protein [Crossiella cryophila]MBB4679690.1 hypothetical protein [Crossiella cryophila]
MTALRHNTEFAPVLALHDTRAPMVADELRARHLGVTPCPAAPLLAASLRRRGVTSRRGPLAFDQGCGDHRALGFAVSWVDGRGRRVGLGAAANADDPRTLAAAARVVREFSAVLGPRTVLLLAEPEPVDLLLALDPATVAPCRRQGRPAQWLRRVTDLRPEWLAGVRTLGVLTHPDTERRLVTQVVSAIHGLGPATVIDRGGAVPPERCPSDEEV